MKKAFTFATILLFECLMCNAQITSYSVNDVNQDELVDISDINKVVGKITSNDTSDHQVVNVAELNNLLKLIDTRLAAIEEKLGICEQKDTTITYDDSDRYAYQKEAEAETILNYISSRGIHVISEDEFGNRIANNVAALTDTTTNEYVLFSDTGVYMQIIERGTGELLKSGESATVLCRFTEYNLKGDSIQLSNMTLPYSAYSYIADEMNVTKKSGSFYGSFVNGNSLMYSQYGSATVPYGWLVPLSYIGLGRYTDEHSKMAHVKLIVPHDQGQSYAANNVYACAYDIYYMRGL